jgi:hypothetical protein
MNTSIIKICLFGLLAAGIAGTSAHLRAQDTNVAAAEKKQPKPKHTGVIPFHGTLKAVDQTARTVSVGEITVHITHETKIDKAGKPMRLEDGVVGEPVSGGYTKAADGTLKATVLHLGPKETVSHSKKKAASGETK